MFSKIPAENVPIQKGWVFSVLLRSQKSIPDQVCYTSPPVEPLDEKSKLSTLRCLQLTQKKWFDYSILVFIGINCITLAMERPSIPPHSFERKFLTFSGYVFTFIFTLEMAMKVLFFLLHHITSRLVLFHPFRLSLMVVCLVVVRISKTAGIFWMEY